MLFRRQSQHIPVNLIGQTRHASNSLLILRFKSCTIAAANLSNKAKKFVKYFEISLDHKYIIH